MSPEKRRARRGGAPNRHRRERAARRVDALQASSDYSESYFLHGFSVQAAEALAEWTHRRIRASWALPPIAGSVTRGAMAPVPIWSSTKSSSVCSTRRNIGVTLTQGFQIVPEQSTAAIVMHHPKATYFNAAAQRELAAT